MTQEQLNELLASNPSPEAEIQYQKRNLCGLQYDGPKSGVDLVVENGQVK